MKRRIAGLTVVREAPEHPAGRWWVMNKRETGFASFGYPHPSLADVLANWDVRIVGAGVDRHSVYVEVVPAGGAS